MTFQVVLVALQVAVTVSILVYASWSDYKTREVSNWVWAVYAPLAIVLSISDLLIYEPLSKLPLFGISVGFTVGLAFLLFYSGGFGGADSKALMCIALALPFAPVALFIPIFGQSPISQFIFPLTIFGNAVLFAAVSGVYIVLRNVFWHKMTGKKMFAGSLAQESLWKKVLVLITGYKMTVVKLKEKWHIFPLEDLQASDENVLNRKLVVVPSDDGREGIVDRLSNAVAAGKIDSYVWATPGLPMLIFITLGLIVALFFGDIVWLLVRFVLAIRVALV